MNTNYHLMKKKKKHTIVYLILDCTNAISSNHALNKRKNYIKLINVVTHCCKTERNKKSSSDNMKYQLLLFINLQNKLFSEIMMRRQRHFGFNKGRQNVYYCF